VVDFRSDKKFGIKAVSIMPLLCLWFMAGCGMVATQKGFYTPITAELQQGNYQNAAQALEKARKKFGGKDRFVYFLDAGLAWHYAGQLDTSTARLHDAEEAADELFTKSISRAALSLVLNDNVLEYAGEDYEILYANLFKSLNFVNQNNHEAAFVEIRRANEKLNLLEDKYRKAADEFNSKAKEDKGHPRVEYKAEKVRFNNDAFARYLSMHMYAADGRWDDARIDREWLERAFAEQPHIYDFEMPLVTYLPSDRSKVILSVVGLAGLAPVKEALELRIRTDSELDLVQVLYIGPSGQETEYFHFPLAVDDDIYLDLAVPQFVDRPHQVAAIKVLADGIPMGSLHLIEKVGMVARETFNAKKSLIYLRMAIRTLTKGVAAYKKKEEVKDEGLGGWLKKAAIDAVYDISENADLRCSRLLPGEVYVGDFELAPGTYDLAVQFLDGSGRVIRTQTFPQYKVLEKGLNLVEAFALE